ncbi:hypothetical protein ACVWZM_004495 [Bradyrhizobium sp. USDA 4501]
MAVVLVSGCQKLERPSPLPIFRQRAYLEGKGGVGTAAVVFAGEKKWEWPPRSWKKPGGLSVCFSLLVPLVVPFISR